MEKFKDEIEIINCGKKLREMGIKFREGLIKWKVCVGIYKNNKCIWEEKYQNIKDNKMDWLKKVYFMIFIHIKIINHSGALFYFYLSFKFEKLYKNLFSW